MNGHEWCEGMWEHSCSVTASLQSVGMDWGRTSGRRWSREGAYCTWWMFLAPWRDEEMFRGNEMWSLCCRHFLFWDERRIKLSFVLWNLFGLLSPLTYTTCLLWTPIGERTFLVCLRIHFFLWTVRDFLFWGDSVRWVWCNPDGQQVPKWNRTFFLVLLSHFGWRDWRNVQSQWLQLFQHSDCWNMPRLLRRFEVW